MTGREVEEYAKTFEEKNDDYTSIIVKALSDRFAEALAEKLHCQIRREWNSPDENIDLDSLIKEKYQGIRPAPGYPACPDHSEKKMIWELLDIEKNLEIELTESCAINPPCSISGMYFDHQESKYFMLGKLVKTKLKAMQNEKIFQLMKLRSGYVLPKLLAKEILLNKLRRYI